MRRAIEESERVEQAAKQKEEEEEAELIRQAIEASAKEEEARKQVESEIKAEAQDVEVKGSAPKDEPKPTEVKPVAAQAKKLEEEKQEDIVATPATTIPPEKLIEITGKPAMSHAELKKLEELKRLKREAKQKKVKELAEQAERKEAIQTKADALPPVALKRRGQFEMVPDFLQKETKKDLASLAEMDMMADAMAKQDKLN